MPGRVCGTWVLVLGLMAGPAGTARGQVAARSPAGRTSAAVSGEPLDLNTASVAQLRTLPGIGEAYARRIVEGRPYLAKNQLATRGVLPQAAYEQIKELVVARRVARP